MSAARPTDVLTPDLQRATETDEVLHVWAKALGCPADQVTDVVRRAGLPIEKLWKSIAGGDRNHQSPRLRL